MINLKFEIFSLGFAGTVGGIVIPNAFLTPMLNIGGRFGSIAFISFIVQAIFCLIINKYLNKNLISDK